MITYDAGEIPGSKKQAKKNCRLLFLLGQFVVLLGVVVFDTF